MQVAGSHEELLSPSMATQVQKAGQLIALMVPCLQILWPCTLLAEHSFHALLCLTVREATDAHSLDRQEFDIFMQADFPMTLRVAIQAKYRLSESPALVQQSVRLRLQYEQCYSGKASS